MFLSATVFFLAMNGLSVLLPRDQLPERSLLLAVFGSLLKCSWGLLVSCLMLYLALSPGCLFGSFLQHPSMLVASKLSYCVYVVQYTVVYGIYRNVTTPLMNGGFNTVGKLNLTLKLPFNRVFFYSTGTLHIGRPIRSCLCRTLAAPLRWSTLHDAAKADAWAYFSKNRMEITRQISYMCKLKKFLFFSTKRYKRSSLVRKVKQLRRNPQTFKWCLIQVKLE